MVGLGMRVPSTLPRRDLDASPEATAIRAVAESCDIDDDEYYILSAIPPIKIFATPDNGRQTKVSSGCVRVIVFVCVLPCRHFALGLMP